MLIFVDALKIMKTTRLVCEEASNGKKYLMYDFVIDNQSIR